jgi:hypothetical protein
MPGCNLMPGPAHLLGGGMSAWGRRHAGLGPDSLGGVW